MAFGQKNYQEKVGNGQYTIAEVGCFLTAFSNLLERFGEIIDPPSLNGFFMNKGAYLRDPDGSNEDLGWGSVSAYDPSIHVMATGGSGWPSNDNAIVKFLYRSPHSGQMVTHFCLVASAANRTILDSWDGVVKDPGIYGQPIAWAEYEKPAPAPITPTVPENHESPVSPSPADYDGHSVTIQPGWGLSNAAEAAGYPDAGTPARWEAIAALNGSGDWTSFNAALKPGQRIVVGQYSAPAPTPAPAEPAKPANIVYTRLDTPLDLMTNKPTHKWDLGFEFDHDAVSVQDLPVGSLFRAVGKGQKTNHDRPCYYMTEEDFGNADQTGIPTNNHGVNTVDLSPAPAPAPTPQPEQPPAPTPPAPESEGEAVPVKIDWKGSFTKFLSPQRYIANKNVVVKDLEDESPRPDMQLINKQLVIVGGTFSRNGQKYYRTAKSAEAGVWYGIPEEDLTKESDLQEDNLMDELLHEAPKIRHDLDIPTNKEKMLGAVASVEGVFSRAFHRNKK